MSELSNLGPGSDDLHRRARERDERLRRIIEESNRTGIPTEVLLEREALQQQQATSKRNEESESKRTTKSFSGLLKSLRAKYGIKSASEQSTSPSQDQSTRESPATIYILDEEDDPRLYGQRYGKALSDEGETFEDDPRDWEGYEKNASKSDRETTSKHTEQSRTRTQNAHDEMERFFGDEKSYSMQVPIPHGNLSKTNVPPVSWKPGVGAVKALSELASYFKALSDEKTFGQAHREKAMELLQKASAWDYFKQSQKPQEHQEIPAINRVHFRMSEGTPAFDPNPAGPPAPEPNPTQEEIWNQIVEEEAKHGRTPAFHPNDENIPYAEKFDGAVPAFIFDPEQKAFKVGDRIQEVGSNPKNPQVNGPYGEVTSVPKGNKQDVDYQMDDGDFVVSAKPDSLYKTTAKALSVLNSFFKSIEGYTNG